MLLCETVTQHNTKQISLLYQTVDHCDRHVLEVNKNNKEIKITRLLKTESGDSADRCASVKFSVNIRVTHNNSVYKATLY